MSTENTTTDTAAPESAPIVDSTGDAELDAVLDAHLASVATPGDLDVPVDGKPSDDQIKQALGETGSKSEPAQEPAAEPKADAEASPDKDAEPGDRERDDDLMHRLVQRDKEKRELAQQAKAEREAKAELEQRIKDMEARLERDPLSLLREKGHTIAALSERALLGEGAADDKLQEGDGKASPELRAMQQRLEALEQERQQMVQEREQRQAQEREQRVVSTVSRLIEQADEDYELVGAFGKADLVAAKVREHMEAQGGGFATEREAREVVALHARTVEKELQQEFQALLGNEKVRAVFERALGAGKQSTGEPARAIAAPGSGNGVAPITSSDGAQQRVAPADEAWDLEREIAAAVADMERLGL